MQSPSYWRSPLPGVLISALPLPSVAGSVPAPLSPLPDLRASTPSGPMIELGKMLYFDPRLSGDGSTSCASCHEPELGWGDGNALSRGYPGTMHWRNSQSVLNVAYLNKFFWTGSAATLEAQAKSAMTGPLAQNMNVGLAEEAAGGEEDAIALIDSAELERALALLRPLEREALFLAAVEGYTAKEIGELTQQPRGTVLSLIHRARHKLRSALTAFTSRVRSSP